MRIGFVSTRLAGTDGVSLETAKWATVLQRMGHEVFYCAGELDASGPPGFLLPEAHFTWPENEWISTHAFGTRQPCEELLPRIEALTERLQDGLRSFVSRFGIDLLVLQNALAIPMQMPLGLAITAFLEDTGMPAIGHHHDFSWERERFSVNCVGDLLARAFPPDVPSLRHVVINSIARQELAQRRGLDAVVVPNVLDFDAPRVGVDEFNADLPADIGLREDELFILQPTRVVPRKGIELSIELLRRLGMVQGKRPVLVIVHKAGDEGLSYLHDLQSLAERVGVGMRYVAERFDSERHLAADGRRIYSLWDAYAHAAFVTYPSLVEGFGNALVEAVFFKVPALVNRYPVYKADIAPLGFDFVEIDGKVTDEAVEGVRQFLTEPERRRTAVETNYEVGARHLSYGVLRVKLRALLREMELPTD